MAQLSPLALLAVALTVGSPSRADAQSAGYLVGSVVDDLGSVAVDGAVVSILGTELSATTGGDGRFQIVGAPLGVIGLRIARPGYVTVVERIEMPAAEAALVEVRLSPVASVLEEMLVTTRAGRAAVRSREEIEIPERGGQHKTAMDLLRAAVPGLRVASGTAAGWGRGSSVRIRGPSSLVRNQPAIYVDGIRVGEMLGGAGGTHVLDLISADDVVRIQILRGPSAEAYYGADAMNGVIVVETRRHRRPGEQR